jgi:hypothetical protein
MKYRNMAVFTLLLLAAVVLAFGACSSSSDPTGTSSKGLAFEVDENGNNSHPDDWEDLHQSWDSGDAPFCGSCHAPDVPEPGCFNNTLCHGADGDDSDSDTPTRTTWMTPTPMRKKRPGGKKRSRFAGL